MNEIIKAIEAEQIRTDLPEFNVGDTVKVQLKLKKVTEKESKYSKELLLKRQNGGIKRNFHSKKSCLWCWC